MLIEHGLRVLDRAALEVNDLISVADVIAARRHHNRDDRALGHLGAGCGVLLEDLTNRPVGLLPLGGFLNGKLSGIRLIGEHVVDRLPDKRRHRELFLARAAGRHQQEHNHKRDHRDHGYRDACGKAGALGQTVEKALRLAHGGCSLTPLGDVRGMLLRGRAARRALHIPADDLRLARLVVGICIAEALLFVVLELFKVGVQRLCRSIAPPDIGAHGVHHDLVQPLGDAGHLLAGRERHGV